MALECFLKKKYYISLTLDLRLLHQIENLSGYLKMRFVSRLPLTGAMEI